MLLLQTFILFLCPPGGSRWAPTHTQVPRPGSTLVATLIGTITTCLISTDSTARLQPPPPTSNPQGSACQETERKVLPFPPLINITSASSASSQMYRASDGEAPHKGSRRLSLLSNHSCLHVSSFSFVTSVVFESSCVIMSQQLKNHDQQMPPVWLPRHPSEHKNHLLFFPLSDQ